MSGSWVSFVPRPTLWLPAYLGLDSPLPPRWTCYDILAPIDLHLADKPLELYLTLEAMQIPRFSGFGASMCEFQGHFT